jgi:hypothetical protein
MMWAGSVEAPMSEANVKAESMPGRSPSGQALFVIE